MALKPADPTYPIKHALATSTGVERQADFLDRVSIGELDARRELDRLEVAGEVERIVVGEHLFIRTADATGFDGTARHSKST